MKILRTKQALREHCDQARREDKKVGLVPTMGALHAGHTSLMDAAIGRGVEFLVATIFVNPLQFAKGEDLSSYPKTMAADLALCRAHGVNAVFIPSNADIMYGPGFCTTVHVGGVTQALEGRFRPTHFDGVTTVVAKLFMLVGSCTAIFGRKDYQQWRTLTRMVADLDMPVEVVGEPIVREADGLALSSRNVYLSPAERQRALCLSRGLGAAQAQWAAGERNPTLLVTAARTIIAADMDRIDYVQAAHPDDLSEVSDRSGPLERLVILAAAYLGETRLIDNIELGPTPNF